MFRTAACSAQPLLASPGGDRRPHGELKSEERVYNVRLLITLLGRMPPEAEAETQAQAVERNWDGWMDAIATGRDAPATPETDTTPEPEPEPEGMVWEDGDLLLTDCQPQEGYGGEEDGTYGDHFYQRTLTSAEEEYWDAEGRDTAFERGDRLGIEWHLGRPTFLPLRPELSEPSAAAGEPEGEGSEAGERCVERPAGTSGGPVGTLPRAAREDEAGCDDAEPE